MPFSNERSISLSGEEDEIINCVSFFLTEIGQVRNETFSFIRIQKFYLMGWVCIYLIVEKRKGKLILRVVGSVYGNVSLLLCVTIFVSFLSLNSVNPRSP